MPTDKERMDWLDVVDRTRIYQDAYGVYSGQFSIERDKRNKKAKRFNNIRDAIDAGMARDKRTRTKEEGR